MVTQGRLVHPVTITVIISLLVSLKETAASMTKPGCPETCGNVTIVYPFGIGRGCYHSEEFQINCYNSSNPPFEPYEFQNLSNPPYPFLPFLEVRVLHTSLESVRIDDWTWSFCNSNCTFEAECKKRLYSWSLQPFSYSHTENKLIGIGCDIFAYVGEHNRNPRQAKYAGGCASVCNIVKDQASYGRNSCTGFGCCQTTFSNDLSDIDVWAVNISSSVKPDQCRFALIAENNFSQFHQFNTSLSSANNVYFYPSVMNWAIGNKSCHEAQNAADYACGRNSYCVDPEKRGGYKCQCNDGFHGNPYIDDGCEDVDECKVSNNTVCKKGYVCVNTDGGYYCACPHGRHSSESGCARDKGKLRAAILVSSAIGSAVFLIILLSSAFWLHREVQKRKQNKLKKKFFKKNGGILLQQQISSSSQGNVAKIKLYTMEELEKVTDNFNASRLLGKGGHGRVYKGMLLDGSIVAIKKSIIADERQVVEFVNEVFILSEINHRHIVKLFGCCLESEVPLLVYEYVSNSTLFYHLHDEDLASTLSWEKRLRIADEIAGALAYLHSYASPTILHRDIKSSNILLDENFRTVISDFGLSRPIAPEKTHLTTLVQGTFGYLDPEYFRSGQFTDKGDVYAFGVVLVELLTGEKVISSVRSEESLAVHFRQAMKQNCLFEILDKVINYVDQKGDILAVAKLAKRCLKLSGKKRPTMKEIAAELAQLRQTMEQPLLQQIFQDKSTLTATSYSYASTSAVTEENVLEEQELIS